MNCNTGEIYTPEEMERFKKFFDGMREVPSHEFIPCKEDLIEMKVEPNEKQLSRKPPKVGRNEPCPCGSGKKFKKCHLLLNYKCTDRRVLGEGK